MKTDPIEEDDEMGSDNELAIDESANDSML